ncbi:hypothetical protein OIU74_000001 [Salix koriyanagi]|uniref:Uncharacterized protein n=1 Tax=Salix koriyanagi TaxID=2511006 RepID=A0A9Q0X1S5_9ROSI|nr:hypothetical protein OIU74_000001 [Salix koriyanagi]
MLGIEAKGKGEGLGRASTSQEVRPRGPSSKPLTYNQHEKTRCSTSGHQELVDEVGETSVVQTGAHEAKWRRSSSIANRSSKALDKGKASPMCREQNGYDRVPQRDP